MYYPCSENKDADQLRGYREADLRLCFRPCNLLVFSRTGSIDLFSHLGVCSSNFYLIATFTDHCLVLPCYSVKVHYLYTFIQKST